MPYPRTREDRGGSCREVYPIEADTLLLLDTALREARAGDRVLEVGTGSGYIASALTAVDRCVIATEINPYAARMAKARGLQVIRTDLVAGVRGQFDLVLFNPPYLPTADVIRADDWLEIALDGGPTGREVIGRFASVVGELLSPVGRVLLLVSSLTGEREVQQLFEGRGFAVQVVERMEYEGEELMVMKIMQKNNQDHPRCEGELLSPNFK
ncbi:MAG: methyltransferase [Methanomicrobiales archaeon]|nr:methyltransferase [Methanomicrobiales archaeon]